MEVNYDNKKTETMEPESTALEETVAAGQENTELEIPADTVGIPMEENAEPKRTTRKKKAEAIIDNTEASQENTQDAVQDTVLPNPLLPPSELPPADAVKQAATKEVPSAADVSATVPTPSPARKKPYVTPVLTIINNDQVETESAKEDAIWHEIHNAYRTRKIMTGQFGGIKQMDNGKTIAIVDYKGFRYIYDQAFLLMFVE